MANPSSATRLDEPSPIVFCDFDGTITQVDVTDAILERLADPQWRDVEQAWVRGEIGSRECLARQMALVRASARELGSLIDSIPTDPGFADFYRCVEDRGVPFYVLSDGFDYVVRRVLRRSGVEGELRNGRHLFASALRLRGRRALPSFPHPAAGCEHGCATCKAAIMRRLGRGRRPVIFIGDGLSDRFAVQEASLVLAKNRLLDYCQENGIACQPFRTFADVQKTLDGMLAWGPAAARHRGSRKALAAVP